MKFTITRESFQQGLAAVSTSIPARSTLPVLSNILLKTEGDGLRVSGTDLDISVSVLIPATVEEEGTITVAAKKLQELVRELPEQPARVSTEGDVMELVCGRATFRFNGLPAEEFPTFPVVDFGSAWQVTADMLHSLIRQTRFAVSTEESRPILNGVLWELSDEKMRMVATNGHRLARMTVPLSTPSIGSAEFIVPPKALDQVERLFRSTQIVEVARTENHLGFRHAGTEVFTRLIDGPYPKYNQVIPVDNDKIVVVDRNALTKALRRMAVVASEQTHRVRLAFVPGTVRLSVETSDLGQGREDMEIDYNGEAIELGFNANYLLEILRYIPSDEVRLSLNNPERAVLLEPVTTGEEQLDYLCLVMPLRINE